MKRLWNVLVLTLAANFLALSGIVAWLYQGGHLDRPRVQSIKEILFPPPQPEPPASEPSAPDPTTQPTLKLEELLAKHSNLPAGEQVEFIQRTFDAHMAQLERQRRVLDDLKAQVDLANQTLASDRAKVEADGRKLEDERQQAEKLASDQGFKGSLNLYSSMPPRQVKQVFMTLGD